MRNVNVGLVKDSVLQIDFLYDEGAKGEQKLVAKNVVMENIKVAQTPRVLNVKGFPAASITDVRDLQFELQGNPKAGRGD